MKEQIRKIINEIVDDPITDDESPMYVDSIDFMDIIIAIEGKYDIHIDEYTIDRNISLNELVKLVEKIRQEKLNVYHNENNR